MASAGHLPLLVRRPGGAVERLQHAQGPPLGTALAAVPEVQVRLEPDALLVLYTDGLVEDRHSDIDDGIDALAALVERAARPSCAAAPPPRWCGRCCPGAPTTTSPSSWPRSRAATPPRPWP